MLANLKIDNNWTLFLDRDGVINKRLVNEYIASWKDFEFLPGVLNAIPIFNSVFKRILIVTNQQGIGKGLMSKEDLLYIHERMLEMIYEHGGMISNIYFCPLLESDKNNCRKPDRFMADQAKKEFPEINFEQSIMVGDMPDDIKFGQSLGMKCVQIKNHKSEPFKNINPDFMYSSLIDFASDLQLLA